MDAGGCVSELADPRIKITALPYPRDKLNPDGANGLWIELGELNLYPVENGVPDLLVKANRLIRPIRCDQLNLNTLDPWDGDPIRASRQRRRRCCRAWLRWWPAELGRAPSDTRRFGGAGVVHRRRHRPAGGVPAALQRTGPAAVVGWH